VKRATERVLERRAFVGQDQADVFIRGTVAPSEDARAYEARLYLVAGDGTILGERRLFSEGPNCAKLTAPLALVIGLAIDTLKRMPRKSLRIVNDRAAPKVWKVEAAPTVVATWGLLPARAIGFGVDARVGQSGWAIESGFSWFLPGHLQTAGDLGADFHALTASLSFCSSLAGSVAELWICLGTMGGAVTGGPLTGSGVERAQLQTSLTWGVTAQTVLLLHLGQTIVLEPRVGLVLPLVRDRFTYTDEMQPPPIQTPLYRPSAVWLNLQFAVPIRIF
jgi:hypothetical protein